MSANTDIRREAKANGVPLWRIAEFLKISEPTMSRRMRKEMPDEEKKQMREIISQLAQEV